MPDSPSIDDAMIADALLQLRLAAGEQARADIELSALEKDLAELLRNRNISDAGRRQITAVLNEAGGRINGVYKKIAAIVDSQAVGALFARRTVQAITAIGLEANAPSLVDEILIQGSGAVAWWAKQAADLVFKFASVVRQGIVNGDPNERIVANVVTPGGVFNGSRRAARALVHTSVQTSANEARRKTFQNNRGVIKGLRHLSTLDSHTSLICVGYSGAAWDLDYKPILGNKLPFNGGTPRHFNCRSIEVPITKTYRELGLDIEDIPLSSTRASSLGPIGNDNSFEGFLKRQSKEFVDEMLGVGRADLWRANKITLRDLINGVGRPLTLEQLEKRAGV